MGVIIKSSLVLALILYFISGTLYVLGGKKEVQTLFLAAKVAALGGALANLTALVLRTMMTGRLPLTDGYEFFLTPGAVFQFWRYLNCRVLAI
jgi:hypothetical protein